MPFHQTHASIDGCALPPPLSAAPELCDRIPHTKDTAASSKISLSDDGASRTDVSSQRTRDSIDIAKLEPYFANTNASVQRIPFAQLLLAHIGAALTLFLATTDATIVSTSLPTIVADLKGAQNQYSWVGVAYLLTQTAFQPLYGRFSDLLGRKTVLYSSVAIFMLGSLLCGLAPTLVWLCIFRALAGVGAGGIVSSVWMITSELVEEEKRAKWSQALSVTWSASALAGPLLGGVFSDGGGMHVTWRWAFYITIPIGSVAFVILYFSLRNVTLRQAAGVTWAEMWTKFDFIGLIAFMGGTVSVILGFSFSSEAGWASPSTLVPLLVGFTVLVIGSVYEMRTKRDPLFPASMFSDVRIAVILIISFLHNFAFNAGTFYLALYYQARRFPPAAVNGSNALHAGLRMLPYSLGSSLASMPAAWFIGYCHRSKKTTRGAEIIVSLGLAISLMITLGDQSSFALQVVSPLVAGIGIGMLFHAPYQILTKALGPEDISSATSAFFLVRFTGSTTGLAVAGAIFTSRLLSSPPTGFAFPSSGPSVDLRYLAQIEPLELRQAVLKVVSVAIKSIWIACTPCLGVSFLLSVLVQIRPRTPDSLSFDPAHCSSAVVKGQEVPSEKKLSEP
ncbi:MFS general substrate transporter [Rickenella mellea]|uniref:MFS general substrate transporter n=1 Tax=Rickenella mellea TaxID=50990 RepID=A0A4Y7QN09_9AGAM|nr:MFS general substrate transporter [Rickenella mellea]